MKPTFRLLTALLTLVTCTTGMARDWPDPTANEVLPYETAGLTHGPMIGAATEHSIRVWARTAAPGEVELVYDVAIPFTQNSKVMKAVTTAEGDHIAVFEVKALQPDTRYFYGIRIGGALADIRPEITDQWPSFRTFPNGSTTVDALHNPRGLFINPAIK